MRTKSAIALLALAGLVLAVSVGFAAYLASRDSVGLPVTKLDRAPRDLAPTVAREPRRGAATTRATTTVEDRRGGTTQTTDDRSRRGRGGGSSSGRGGGGGGDD